MPDSIKEISQTGEISSGGASCGGEKGHGHKKKQIHHNEKDLVEISSDARKLQPDKGGKSIFDYLKSLFRRTG